MKKVFLYGFLISLLLLALSACTKEPAQELLTEEPQIETAAPETPSQETQSDAITAATPEQTIPEQIATPEPVQQEPEKADPAPVEPEQPAKVIFTEVNETVYATSTVNIRVGYTTASDKIGSLGWGQNVVRTGIGTGEAEGWSQVKLSDGTIAYISSQYLSTTKPVSNSSGSGSSGSQGSSGIGVNQMSLPTSQILLTQMEVEL